jgi:hypothetical protein
VTEHREVTASSVSSGEALARLGLPAGDAHDLPPAAGRFPDGAQFRVEIPSVEGPDSLAAVLAAAERFEVPVSRVSQGTGVGLLTDAEIRAMVDLRPAPGWS